MITIGRKIEIFKEYEILSVCTKAVILFERKYNRLSYEESEYFFKIIFNMRTNVNKSLSNNDNFRFNEYHEKFRILRKKHINYLERLQKIKLLKGESY